MKQRCEAEEARVRLQFLADGDAARVLRERTRWVEDLVRRAWQERVAPAASEGLCLLAVGGFGRRELFPHSDVDLLILAGEAAPEAPLAAFLAQLWDAGLRPSHSVRRIAESLRLDPHNLELSISLLDQRYLAGDSGLYAELENALPRFVRDHKLELARSLSRLARRRHARFEGTVHHLEPDVKDAPGGLRDLHLTGWLARLAATGRHEPYLSVPLEPLHPARELLSMLRCFLHFRAARDENRLSFDAQEELAEQPFAAGRDPALWMRQYYRCARGVHRAAIHQLESWEAAGSSLWTLFRDWRSRASSHEFSAVRGRVWIRSPVRFAQDPESVLRLFEFIGRHGLRPAADTERLVREALPRLRAAAGRAAQLWASLTRVLASPYAGQALRTMHETGALAAILPEWKDMDCLVVRDFLHRYTVDEHTFVALEELAELPRAQDPQRRRFAALLEEIDDPLALRAALLFHDSGKTQRTLRHVPASIRIASQALARLGAPASLQDRVCRLIERHLELSEFMLRRDPEDTYAVRQLAQRMETPEYLRELTLLTYADVSAVHPQAMTPWRLQLLWQVYRAAARDLTRELDAERLPRMPALASEAAAFLEGFPARYLRTRSEAAVEADLRLCRRAVRDGVAVQMERRDGVWVVRLAARDRTFLLASVAGGLTAFGVNILKAEAFSNRQGIALDEFVFEDPNRTLELNPGEAERLRLILERAALGRADVGGLLAARLPQRPLFRRPRLKPSVLVDNTVSPASTLIEVVAADRPGLLYDLARTISSAGCNIEVVLLDTRAQQALDVFYVTLEGRKLEAAAAEALREKLLAVCCESARCRGPAADHTTS